MIGQASAQTHVWEDKANGQLILTCGANLYYAPNNNKWNQDQLIGNQPIACGGAPGFEWEPSNWNVTSYPNSPTASVLISSAPPVELGIAVDIGDLQLTAGNELQMFTGSVLNVHNAIVNDGLIRLNDLVGGDTILRINGNVGLTGSGQILFDSLDDNTIDSADPSYVLTIGANQTLRADSDTLIDQSHINTSFVNNGTITADGGWLQIKNHPTTNNNVLRAVNGGTLRLLNTTLENPAGTITADIGSTVRFGGSTVVGGTLDGAGAFELETSDAVFDGTVSSVTNDGTVNIDGYDKLTVKGTFTNEGIIVLNDASGDVAAFEADGNAILDGNGKLRFESNDDNWITSANPTDVLTIGADQELITSADALAGDSASRIITAIANNGTITADQGGLQLDTHPKTNNSLIHAVNGGLIRFSNVTVTNDEGGGDPAVGTITADAGSTVRFAATTVVGGTLDGAGIFELETSDAVFDGTDSPVTNGGTVNIDGYDKLTIKGIFTNDGTIVLNDLSGDVSYFEADGNAILNGNGKLRFESADDNWITSANPTDVLTIGADQELITSADTLAGDSASRIITSTANNGTITADQGGLQLDTHPKTNNNLIQAINGGLVRFSNVTVTNDEGGGDPAVGTITADAGSTVRFNAATVVGGTLNGSGAYTLEGRATVFDGSAMPPTFDSSITLDGNNTLTLKGTIHNEGTIHLDDHGWASQLLIDGDVTLDGSGQMRFESNDDNVIESLDPADTLTVGADQTLTTADVALTGQSRIITALNNQGVVEARVGGLTLNTNPKTNNGIFRAVDGGTLQILAPDTILTNFDPLSHTLTGGRWEIIANGTDTTMSFAGDPDIERIGPGTTVVLSGSQSMFPGTEALVTLEGVLSLRNKRVFATNGNLDVNGHLEFGLTSGAADGWNATMLHVTDINLAGSVIDIVDLGITPGTYRIIQYDGTRTGTPVMGTVPAGFNFTLDTSNPGFVDLLVNTEPAPSGGQLTSSSILNSTAGEAYEHQIQADNQPTEFTATGLPDGLILDPATGIISGTPLASGLFTVEVTAVGPDQIIRQKLTIATHSPEVTVFDNNNIGGVSSGPSNPTIFTLADPTRITYVMDYHYFNGGISPGTIALRHSDGTTYGPWPAEGRVGQGGVQNAYWEVWPMEVLKPGTYTVIDSDTATWSHNSTSGNRGMSIVKGQASPFDDAQVLALWAANNGLEGADAAPNADPDGDATANWIEIACGTNPAWKDPVAQPQLTATAGGDPSVSFTVGTGGTGVPGGNFVINGARISLKITSNMADWNPSTELLELANAQRQPLDGGRETLTIPLKPDMLPLGSWFIRAELSSVQGP